MPANQAPIFTLTPRIWSNTITQSNPSKSNLQGQTGVWTTIASGNNFGSRIEYVKIIATGTNVAGVVRLFIDDSKCSPNPYVNTGYALFAETATTAVTASATAAGYSTELVRTDGRPLLVLSSGVLLTATSEKDDPNGHYLIQAHGGDF